MTSLRRPMMLLPAAAACIAGSWWFALREPAGTPVQVAARPAEREAPAAAPCLPGELACGLQRPVRSDGTTPFVNEDMGISAIFPEGSWVCLGRSGNAARGFYAWYGVDVEGCPERGDIRAAAMGIGSSFNALDYKTPREAVGECRPLSALVKARIGRRHLGFPGHQSLVCQDAPSDGTIMITVHAVGGRWPGDLPQQVPHIVYRASLGTFPERLERDLQMFRTFLRKLRIGVVSE